MWYLVVDMCNGKVYGSFNQMAAEEMVKSLIAKGVAREQILVFNRASAKSWTVTEHVVKTVQIAD